MKHDTELLKNIGAKCQDKATGTNHVIVGILYSEYEDPQYLVATTNESDKWIMAKRVSIYEL